MNKVLYWLSVCSCVFFMGNIFSDSFINLSDEKNYLRDYHDSGAYYRDFNKVLAEAEIYINQQWQQATEQERKKMTIVYDIDETALSNYQVMLNNDFGCPIEYVVRSQSADLGTGLPTLKFYQTMQKKGINQIFITGRKEDLRTTTVKNLHQVGYSDWQELYLEPLNAHFNSAADFKARIRKNLISQGYDIVMTIGDQCSDLADSKILSTSKDQQIPLPEVCGTQQVGAYERAAAKLPNPYYHVP